MSEPRKGRMSVRLLAARGLIAAMYVALTLLSSFFGLAFGPIQVRLSEALTLLPALSGSVIPALTVGCMLSNLVGLAMGNPLGWLDLVVGTAATALAGWLSWLLRSVRLRGLPVLSALPPVLCNAVLVGLELTLVYHGSFIPAMFGWYALTVGAGQLIACMGLGLPLYAALRRSRFFSGYLEAH